MFIFCIRRGWSVFCYQNWTTPENVQIQKSVKIFIFLSRFQVAQNQNFRETVPHRNLRHNNLQVFIFIDRNQFLRKIFNPSFHLRGK